MPPVAAERADYPVAHHLQQEEDDRERLDDRRIGRDEEEDRRESREDGQRRRPGSSSGPPQALLGDQWVCISLRVQFLQPPLDENEQRGDLGVHGRSEHVQPLAAGHFEPGASANRLRVASFPAATAPSTTPDATRVWRPAGLDGPASLRLEQTMTPEKIGHKRRPVRSENAMEAHHETPFGTTEREQRVGPGGRREIGFA